MRLGIHLVAAGVAMICVLILATWVPVRRPVDVDPPADWWDDYRRLGVGGFLAQCEPVGDPMPDPGHPAGMQCALWRAPARYGPDLVLDCHNGTRDEHGLYERLLLRVPGTCTTPVEAAAWTYGTDVDTYSGLTRRT